MPAAPRPNKLGRKIAYKVNGIPPNLQRVKRTKNQKWVNEKLVAEETQRVR